MSDNKVTDFSVRGCGYERCTWRRMVLDTSEPSVGIFYIDLDAHLAAEHGGKSAPPSADAFSRLFGTRGPW